jgi:hypothetical protein
MPRGPTPAGPSPTSRHHSPFYILHRVSKYFEKTTFAFILQLNCLCFAQNYNRFAEQFQDKMGMINYVCNFFWFLHLFM